MNGAEQRERFTAVKRAEGRLDDVETVTEGLGQVIVDDRRLVAERFSDVHQQIDDAVADLHRFVNRADQVHEQAFIALERALSDFRGMTFWQRLRWLVGV